MSRYNCVAHYSQHHLLIYINYPVFSRLCAPYFKPPLQNVTANEVCYLVIHLIHASK